MEPKINESMKFNHFYIPIFAISLLTFFSALFLPKVYFPRFNLIIVSASAFFYSLFAWGWDIAIKKIERNEKERINEALHYKKETYRNRLNLDIYFGLFIHLIIFIFFLVAGILSYIFLPKFFVG